MSKQYKSSIFSMHQILSFPSSEAETKYVGWWMLEGFLIAYACNVFVLLIFNQLILERNGFGLKAEVIAVQPLIYKTIMITVYRYLGLLYNLFIYTPFHRTGKVISKRMTDPEFTSIIDNMYRCREEV